MNLNENQRFQVTLAALQERYNVSHRIRERSIQFTLWISGMAIALGWLLISQQSLAFSQRVALTLLITAFFMGTLLFILALQRGFRSNREAMIRSERALGMHDAGIYLADAPLLPTEYNCTKRKWSDHFCTLCVWLILVAVSLSILTWTSPDPAKSLPSNNIPQVNGGKK